MDYSEYFIGYSGSTQWHKKDSGIVYDIVFYSPLFEHFLAHSHL